MADELNQVESAADAANVPPPPAAESAAQAPPLTEPTPSQVTAQESPAPESQTPPAPPAPADAAAVEVPAPAPPESAAQGPPLSETAADPQASSLKPQASVPVDVDPVVIDLQRQLEQARVDRADLKHLESRAIAAETKASLLDTVTTELRLENARQKTALEAAKTQLAQVQAALAASDAEVSRLQTARSPLLMAKAAKPVEGRDRLEIVLRRAVPVGGTPREPGYSLGFVQLEEGVTLNYLVDAVRNDLARESGA